MPQKELKNKPMYQALGLAMRDYRDKTLKLTQHEFALKSGVKRSTIASIEKGRQHILLHTLLPILSALGTRLEDLIPGHVSAAPGTTRIEEKLTTISKNLRDKISSHIDSPSGGDDEQTRIHRRRTIARIPGQNKKAHRS